MTLTVRVTGVSDEAGTDEIANTAKVTVGENSYDTNTVTVKAEKCSLEISKTVEGGDPNREFTFDVTPWQRRRHAICRHAGCQALLGRPGHARGRQRDV